MIPSRPTPARTRRFATTFPGPRRRGSAFTLIEMLVALFIFAGILVSLYSTWSLVIRGNESALRMAAEAQRARMAVRTVEDALIGAVFFAQNADLYTFLANTSGDTAELSLVSVLGDSFPGSGYFQGDRMRRVTFQVQGDHELVLYQNSLLAADTDTDKGVYPTVLARDVRLFQLEFWDRRRGDWAPEWLLTNQLPEMIRLTIGLGQSANNRSVPDQVVTKLIRLPSLGVLP